MNNSIFRSLGSSIALAGLLTTIVNAQTVRMTNDITTIKKIITENKFVIIDAYADWCKPCRAMTPILKQIAKQYENVVVVKVNTDFVNLSALNTLVGQNVQNIPLFVFFKDSKRVKNIAGPQRLAQLKTHIKSSFNVV